MTKQAANGIRVGVMIPQPNTTVEHELGGWLAPGSAVELLRIPRGKGMMTTETLPAYIANTLELAARFARQDIDVVAFGCTAAGFLLGPEGDRAFMQELRRITTKPVASIANAMTTCLLELGVKRIALVTPYLEAVNDQLKAYISDAGLEVAAFDSLYAADIGELVKIQPAAVSALARRTMTDDCEAMFIACAQLPTQTILDDLRAEFGRPVLSSNQALAMQIRAVGALTPS